MRSQAESKTVVVHDFPHETTFPPKGYGGIERWLWSVARASLDLGHKTIIAGPLWLSETLPDAEFFPERITVETKDKFKDLFGKADFLVGGHEFFGKPEWDGPFLEVAETLLTHQSRTELYDKVIYDRKRLHLFCSTDEMMSRYSEQKPHKLFQSTSGFQEAPQISKPEDYLIWVGRVDEDKSPHFLTLVPEITGLSVYVMARPAFDSEYFQKNRKYLEKKGLVFIGEKGGSEKMEIISKAKAGIYTQSQSYIEAAGLIFPEILCSGVPMAGMTWRSKDAAFELLDLCSGKCLLAESRQSVEEISFNLAQATKDVLDLDRNVVERHNKEKFDPMKLTDRMFKLATNEQ